MVQAFRHLWRSTATIANRRTVQRDNPKSRQSPVGDGRCLISTLKRCSTNQPSESGKENATFNQSEKTTVGKSNPSPVFAAVPRRGDSPSRERIIKRCAPTAELLKCLASGHVTVLNS
ncbi:hypothetical protein RND81_13G054800 [Saponaria officinalis]|uniref:Uncharacterized protein n=1 Tax=Saponaria officinalis TaxID=3572 RepID=A0AAW1H2S1_SAPOF